MTSKQTFRDIDIEKTFALKGTLNYTRYFFKKKTGNKFIVGDHHKIICDTLDRVVSGELKRVIFNVAPRYGKTELIVKNFISYGFAINPKSKFIHLSYSDDLVLDNSKEINNTVSSAEYQRLFEAEPTSVNAKKWYTKQGGGMYAVSSSGQVTGFGAGAVDKEEEEEAERALDEFTPVFDNSGFNGAIIIDDPIKPDDALSEGVREKGNNKFETTIRNRVNSRNTPIIIVMQRLHEHDLCGYLKEIEPDDWTVVSLPCISLDEKGEEKALWPFKHTVEELHKIRDANSYVFETQYMQDPKPIEGLMYETLREYEVIPASDRVLKKNYTDTADEGKDYLCSICYDEIETGCYITDLLYTKKPMEYTEPKTAEMLTKNKTRRAKIESNNGGRGFGRAVEKECRIMKNTQTQFELFTQTDNKHVRIFSNSAKVQNLVFFPKGWKTLWPEFYRDVTGYRKEGGGGPDDAPDTLTGMVEDFGVWVKSKRDISGVFN